MCGRSLLERLHGCDGGVGLGDAWGRGGDNRSRCLGLLLRDALAGAVKCISEVGIRRVPAARHHFLAECASAAWCPSRRPCGGGLGWGDVEGAAACECGLQLLQGQACGAGGRRASGCAR